MAIRGLLVIAALAAGVTACVANDADADFELTPLPAVTPSTEQPTPTPAASSDIATPTIAISPTAPATPAPASGGGAAASPPPERATPTPTPAATPTPVTGPLPLDQINVRLEPVVNGLERPDGFAVPGDGSGRFFIPEQEGRIRIVEDGELLDRPFLDIVDQVNSDGMEQGLVGLAFHPDYTENGYFYVNYSDLDGHTVISRFTVSVDPKRADPTSETLILFVEQPHPLHNGGHLVFGPDGYLWVGLGDGGADSDRFGNAQNPDTLLGAILRLDVDGDEPYAIPEDNPFVEDPNVRDEVWAYGLRNPWRFSFDSETGDLYIADVGQGAREEINVMPAGSAGGENYGWPLIEGTNCFEINPCDVDGLVPPVIEYDHEGGNCAVTGGHVYRGPAHPGLQGVYFYADFCSGRFWGARVAGSEVETRLLFQRKGALFTAFGEDEDGELYILSMAWGTLYRVVGY